MTGAVRAHSFSPLPSGERSTREARRVRGARSFLSSSESPSPHPLHAGRACPTCASFVPNSGKLYCVMRFGARFLLVRNKDNGADVWRVRRQFGGALLRSNWEHVAQAAVAAPLGR